LKEKKILSEPRVIERVLARLTSSIDGRQLIIVKKFDSIIRPYLTRVRKYQDIQALLACVKKLIFERDLTISEFFRLCQNQQANNGEIIND
jgi:hypothetical protein